MTTLLVATTGGHLTQLADIAQRLPDDVDDERVWVTHENAQSGSLLDGERTVFVPYVGVKDARGVLRNVPVAHRLLREHHLTRVISTGSGIALGYLPYLAARGVRAHYVESATRVRRPSLTGRLLSAAPGVHLYTQYQYLARGPWQYAGSVFDGFAVFGTNGSHEIRRAVVTLGTAEEFPFRRLLEVLAPLLGAGGALERAQGLPVRTLWQTGCTPTAGLGIDARPWLPAAEMEAALAAADVVVSHAGTGSALSALRAGRFAVLVPREAARGEIGDEHQDRFACHLQDRGLALRRRVSELTIDDLVLASTRRVHRITAPPSLRLAS